MSENHEGLLETSDAAPLKDDDFPGEFFDDSNDVATFEESSSDAEYEASFESNGHVHGLGDGETLASPLPKKPKRVLRAKIGKPEEVPTPGGLIPWTLSVSAFVCIGTFILFGSKPPASTGGTAAAVAPAPAPAESEPTPTATPVVTPVALAEPAKPSEFDSAAGLFQSGKYKDAQAIFAKLAAENPTDARVFYYAALANGSANNVWNGETETLVNKGIELEKAGTPKVAEIDAAFADLLPQLKTWLGAYRKRVAR